MNLLPNCKHCGKFVNPKKEGITRVAIQTLWEQDEEFYHDTCQAKYIQFLSEINVSDFLAKTPQQRQQDNAGTNHL